VADHRARPTVRPQKLALGVMAHAPLTRAAQKRFCPPLSPEIAAELSSVLLADLLNSLAILPMGQRSVLCVSDEDGTTLQPSVPPRWQIVSAATDRMEDRLAKGLDHLFAGGAEGAAIVRGDVPLMPLDEVFEGMLWLTKRRRLMLGATNTGGVYVVGTTQPEPLLFEGVDWTSPGVVERVRARAEEIGVEVLELKVVSELEEPGDLERLARDLANQPPSFTLGPSQTVAFLGRAGFKP
jgi:hypothetical protein